MLRPCERCGGDGFVADAPCGCREAACPHEPLFGHDEDPREGLYAKYWVRRTDGSSQPGGKHERCEYFVLDWQHDPFAVPAALAYADACEQKCPELAADLRQRADRASREWAEANQPTVPPDVAELESEPWPLSSVLAKLADAAGVLLDEHSYDGHGHEEMRVAQERARQYVAALGGGTLRSAADVRREALKEASTLCGTLAEGESADRFEAFLEAESAIRGLARGGRNV